MRNSYHPGVKGSNDTLIFQLQADKSPSDEKQEQLGGHEIDNIIYEL